jgi:hypothetical protein
MLKHPLPTQSYFKSVGQEECLSLVCTYVEGDNENTIIVKRKIICYFSKNSLRVFEEVLKSARLYHC